MKTIDDHYFSPDDNLSVRQMVSALAMLSVPPPEALLDIDKISKDASSMSLGDFRMDSLGCMEFCIHLEIDHGVIISPEEIVLINTVDQLLDMICDRQPNCE